MRLRNWLLTGTSLALLALAPAAAQARDLNDKTLVRAYRAYDRDPNDANRQALNEACIAAGFASFDECLAALQAKNGKGNKAAPQQPPAPPSAAEAAPAESAPPSDAAAPAAPAPAEQPAAPVEQPAAPAEQPAPAAPAAETPPPVSEAAPAAPAAPPAAEAPAATAQVAPPAAPAEQPAGAPAKLVRAVEQYNQAVADLAAGKKNAQTRIDRAKAQIDSLCADAGFADADSCLAQFGLALTPLPAAPAATPAAPLEQPQPSSEQPISELPNASEAVTPQAVEVLPETVAPAEAAPILDSAKDQSNRRKPREGQVAPTDASSSSEQPAPPAAPAAPPPADDKAAQQAITPPPAAEQSTQTEQGQKVDIQAVVPKPPTNNDQVKVIEQPKTDTGSVIFQIGVNIFINNPTQERDRFYDSREDQIYYEELSRGRVRETIVHRDGSKVVTIYNRNGDVLQRSKILANGREIIIASADPNQDDFYLTWQDPGEELPPLQLTIPASDYILDADQADEDQVAFFLDQPPVEQVRRIYTIDEVKRSARLRDSVRRLEIGGLTFDTGKATISRDQVGELSKVAAAMLKTLDRDPGSVFLIEGHTDAVGSDVSNLVLSDQRAATVARILSDFYEIPAENLVTQGYGERYLKVNTEDAEPLNRRVTIKNITALVSYAGDNG